jgi:hypothetical protein
MSGYEKGTSDWHLGGTAEPLRLSSVLPSSTLVVRANDDRLRLGKEHC